MTDKKKFELEYLLKTSPKVLENMLCTPSGLSEWFANDVNIKDDVLTFFWDGDEESARLLSKRQNTSAKFQWLRDEEEGNE
ncbi:MAG: START-like domain-containing protein, partial [Flavobacteriales bacterium]